MVSITAQRRMAEALKHRHSLRPNTPCQYESIFRIWRYDLKWFAASYAVHGYDNEKTVRVMINKICPFPINTVQPITGEDIMKKLA